MFDIVFVDDEEYLCDLYEEMFTNEERNVICFTDVDEAQKYLNENTVSIVFLDFRMPKMNGNELRQTFSEGIPTFLLTGEFITQEVQGFIDILQKPMAYDLMDSLINKYAYPLEAKTFSGVNPYKEFFMGLSKEAHIWKVIRDEDGEIHSWELFDANQVALDLWDVELEDVVGKTTEEIFNGKNPLAEMNTIPCDEYLLCVDN